MKVAIQFEVEAGKYEADGEKNYKVSFTTENFVDAVEMYNKCVGYPFNDLRVLVGVDDAWSTMTILGEQTEKEMESAVRFGHTSMALDQIYSVLFDKQFVVLTTSNEETIERGNEILSEIEKLKDHCELNKKHASTKRSEYEKLRREHIELRWKLEDLARRGSIGSDDIACILNEK